MREELMSLLINVVIKTKTVDEIPEILNSLKKIKEDNPHSVIKITIKVVPND